MATSRRKRSRRPIRTVAARFASIVAGELPDGWEAHLPDLHCQRTVTWRRATLVATSSTRWPPTCTNLVGGSADLDPSTRTAMKGFGDFESPAMADSSRRASPTQGTAGGVWGYAGRNIHFGLREHAMAAAMTGMALHGGLHPVWRHLPVVLRLHAAQHPAGGIEQGARDLHLDPRQHRARRGRADASARRAVGGLARHAEHDGHAAQRRDRNGGGVARRAAAYRRPCGSRAHPPEAAGARSHAFSPPHPGSRRGAYILAEAGGSPPEVILIATGSEVSLALEAHERLAGDGIRSRVVSMPCWELFESAAARVP